MNKQINKEGYNFKNYCPLDRWASYWHQINEIIDCNPGSVLEVGVGDKVLASYLKNNTKINYTSLDIAEDLNPDIISSVDNISVENNSFDVVCAFEVLEHLPFDKFKRSLEELSRVSKKDVIISLPHWGRHFSLKFRVPFIHTVKFQYKSKSFPVKHEFNGQHYWEIGKKGYSLKKIKHVIKGTGLRLVNDYVVFESPYHHFFILKKSGLTRLDNSLNRIS